MKTKKTIIFLTSFLVTLCITASTLKDTNSSVFPTELTVEYLTNPSDLDDVHPRFSWTLQPTKENEYGQKQTAYRILVASNRNLLKEDKADVWDTDWVASDDMQLIKFGGNKLQSDCTYYWNVAIKDESGNISTPSDIAYWSTGLFSKDDWTSQWIGTGESYDPAEGGNKMQDPWFRRSVNLDQKPSKATLFVASVGYHEVYVNGTKIGNHVLAPAATDHTQRARYIAYDIAPELVKGNNVIALWLGTGWSIFAPYATDDKPRAPIVIAQTDIYNEEGEVMMRVETDDNWKTYPSPNRLIGNWGFGVGGYGGELWDANMEIDNWNLADYDDTEWQNAITLTPSLTLSSQQVEPNRLFEEITPVDIEERSDGSYRVDMGVNFAGWTQIGVKGNPGDSIRFQFSEREQDDMTFALHSAYVMGNEDTRNVRVDNMNAGNNRVTNEVTGTFENRFNYMSGRWITISGATSAPTKEDIKGWMVRTDFADATNFESSDSLQNWIYNTVKWTFENLSLGGIIVDCPQRERFGYGGDAHATSETGLLNYKLGAFYTKWLEDWRDVQGTEPMVGNMNDPEWARKQEGSGRQLGGGIMPQTAPTYHGGGGPAWGGIAVTLPWFLYQYHGDIDALETNFDMIKGWIEFLNSNTKDNMLQRYGGRWDFLGDWLWPDAKSDGMNNDSDENLFFNNCYWVYNLKTAAQIAEVLGKDAEAEQWLSQAQIASEAIHKKYYHEGEFNYSDRSMRSLAAALYGDIMPEGMRQDIINTLENEILVNQNGHIDVGITGGAMLFKVLRDEGRDDLIYSMTSKTTYPSWGLMKESGATTIWEMWEKDLPGHSLLHSSYLYPGAWYIDGVAGIKQDIEKPGYRKFIVRVPNLNEEQMSWAKADFDSPAGLIKSHWQRDGSSVQLDVTVPPNCSATVWFPNTKGMTVSESSGLAKQIGERDGYLLYEVEAGNYQFKN